jgi:hypothetical protein
MQHVLRYWFLRSPVWIFGSFLATIGGFEAQLALKDTAKNLGKPLFQDYSLQGRFIGVLIRLFRILVGALLYACIAVAYAGFFLFWLALPVLCLSAILGSFFGASADLNYGA